MKPLYEQIARIGKQYNAGKIVLFGSRARNDCRERSDIDLAVYGVPETARNDFMEAVEHLPTLLDFDIGKHFHKNKNGIYRAVQTAYL